MSAPSDTEYAIADQLRSIAVDNIEEAQLTHAFIGQKLGVDGDTARALLQRDRWDVGLAIQVVHQLGLKVEVSRR